ncbi:hypothetical protein OPV22_025466 [Ensete ventricosum]|uniref:BHLH domain-containing protein n=1 Tax=Ensete ventricosum TaxID=4639 RepID=A0AAV8QDX0_ENSVE|nr:hypothetical protein OPV22_025466 [Ensete ventricosum]
MNRGLFQNSLVQQMMGGSSNCWSLNSIRPPPEQTFPLLPSSSSSSSPSVSPQYPQPSTTLPVIPFHGSQDLPESWSQLLLAEEAKYGLTPSQTRKMKNWEDRLVYPSTAPHMADIKQEISRNGYLHSHGSEEIQASKSPWSRIIPSSSPGSCIAGSFGRNMLDFSNKSERMHHQPANSPECNSTEAGVVLKKSRVQGTSSAHSTTFKVTKEKLGDRITALHQIVSPFGKTDTASVLLEAIGYIRFLQSQIEALSSPYLSSGSRNMKQPAQGERRNIFGEEAGHLLLNGNGSKKRGHPDQEGDDEPKKDLRSRGLCLVPVSFFLDVGSDNGADYWVPTLHGAF